MNGQRGYPTRITPDTGRSRQFRVRKEYGHELETDGHPTASRCSWQHRAGDRLAQEIANLAGWMSSDQAGGMAPFVLRQAVPADMDILRDVFRRSSLSNEGDRALLLDHPDALVLSDAAVNDGRTRVATAPDGTIVGFATVTTTGKALELEDLFVAPEWMRQGAARQLILDVASIARDRGVSRVAVTGNGLALAFYKSVGFVIDGVVDTEFGTGNRMHLDVTF